MHHSYVPLTTGKQRRLCTLTAYKVTSQTLTLHQLSQKHCQSSGSCYSGNKLTRTLTNVHFQPQTHTHTHSLSLTLAQGGFLEVHIFAYICMFNEFWEIKRSVRPFVGISFFFFLCVLVCVCVWKGGGSPCKYHPLCVGTRHRWSGARAPCGHRIPISVCLRALWGTERVTPVCVWMHVIAMYVSFTVCTGVFLRMCLTVCLLQNVCLSVCVVCVWTVRSVTWVDMCVCNSLHIRAVCVCVCVCAYRACVRACIYN